MNFRRGIKGVEKVRQGFVKAAAVTPKIKVADTKYNTELILDMMKESTRQGAKIVVFQSCA